MTATVCATATRLPVAPEPGSDEWLRYMTGSKVAAVMQLSPYESPYSLWHRMAGIVAPEAEKEIHRRGHYLEPAILAWLADQHPELNIFPTGMWVSSEEPLFGITPDSLAIDEATGEVIVVEAKSALDKDVWGEELSDDIPVYYRCQVMWAMGILGVRRALVGVLTSHLQFRHYWVEFVQAEFDLLVSRAVEFMQSLTDHSAPDIDTHSATYEVVREMHPDIDAGIVIDLPDDLAHGYVNAKLADKAAEDHFRLWTARVADHMASAKTARYQGKTIATRQTRGGGTPFVQAARGLKPLTTETTLEQAS